jgi:hypothetical protein
MVTAFVVAILLKIKDVPFKLIAVALSALNAATVDLALAPVLAELGLAVRFIVSNPLAVNAVVIFAAFQEVAVRDPPRFKPSVSLVPAEFASEKVAVVAALPLL